MKLKSQEFIALLLIFSLMAISCTTMTTQRQKRAEPSKERKHGAKLIITKTDGQQIKGELITVKPNSLLLLDTEGEVVSINIAEIKVIRIVKKSKASVGASIGLLIGAGGGILSAHLFVKNRRGDWADWAKVWGLVFGGIGLLFGGVTGTLLGTDKTIQIEGMTDSEINEVLEELRKKARIRDYK